ncbi:flagellar protein FlaG [Phreatobacter stygius]|uniref:Flagellar protein FlaG n=1 Tax=Phreatobacter stygius TaxID=1940610 RepID=A0A4D7AVI6_9HYPH|nr:flagellar protein FlaG [Phreatobacter stygius]QCI63013.1 flagellar protein FlaG [Phreatobacter stygius]
MDIGSSRPAVGSVYVGRPETALYREAVRTELPHGQRVAQPVSTGATAGANDRRPGDGAARDERTLADRKARMQRIADSIRESLQNRIDKDDDAGTLVYRTVDTDTGKVINQYPDELILKLRAYAREMQRKDEAKLAGANEHARVEKVA